MVFYHSNGNFLTRTDLKVRQQNKTESTIPGWGDSDLNSCSTEESDNRGLAEDRACSV